MIEAIAAKVKASRTRACLSGVQRDVGAKISRSGACPTCWPTHIPPRINTSKPIKTSRVVPELTKVHSGRLNKRGTATGHTGANRQTPRLPRATNKSDWSLAMSEMLDIRQTCSHRTTTPRAISTDRKPWAHRS